MQHLAQRLIAGLVLGSALLAYPADAYHQTWGSFGPALRSCPPEEADIVTPEGVPACIDARPLSDCTADPAGALRLGPGGAAGFRIRPLDARIAGYAVEEDARFHLRGVEDCSGQAWTGETAVALVLRVTIADPTCAGGTCTLPDLTIPHPLPCGGGRCEGHHRGTALLAALGLPPLPTDLAWSAEGVSLAVLDRAGGPMLSPWLSVARGYDGVSSEIPSRAARSEARLVRAYPSCDPAAVDAVTSDGVPACAGLPPLSDCASDPANGISLSSRARRSKLKLSASRDALRYSITLSDLIDCDQNPYDGSVAVVAILRAIINDPRCTGSECTTVDTPVQAEVGVSRGRAVANGTLRVDLGAPVVGVELVRLEVRDPAGRPVLVAPGFNVTCGPQSCYGN
jgi:hypothetical protein